MPKISIITVNYNNADGLQRTMSSVAGQSLTNFEYIVIDGNSNDGSINILKDNSSLLSNWVSESDTGVYQAMNKGIKMATGDYLLFLNSGDTFRTTTTLEEVHNKMSHSLDIYYGDLMFTANNKEFLQEYPKELSFDYFLERSLPHPGSFIKKELFERIFYYTESFKIAADWEFFVCAICKEGVSYQHLELVISNFDLLGMSNEPKNKVLIEEERLIALQKHFPSVYEDALAQFEQQKKVTSPNTKVGKRIGMKTLKKLAKFLPLARKKGGNKTKDLL
jgi:glycosyltransferase involved in cell wall biosynthesis